LNWRRITERGRTPRPANRWPIRSPRSHCLIRDILRRSCREGGEERVELSHQSTLLLESSHDLHRDGLRDPSMNDTPSISLAAPAPRAIDCRRTFSCHEILRSRDATPDGRPVRRKLHRGLRCCAPIRKPCRKDERARIRLQPPTSRRSSICSADGADRTCNLRAPHDDTAKGPINTTRG